MIKEKNIIVFIIASVYCSCNHFSNQVNVAKRGDKYGKKFLIYNVSAYLIKWQIAKYCTCLSYLWISNGWTVSKHWFSKVNYKLAISWIKLIIPNDSVSTRNKKKTWNPQQFFSSFYNSFSFFFVLTSTYNIGTGNACSGWMGHPTRDSQTTMYMSCRSFPSLQDQTGNNDIFYNLKTCQLNMLIIFLNNQKKFV